MLLLVVVVVLVTVNVTPVSVIYKSLSELCQPSPHCFRGQDFRESVDILGDSRVELSGGQTVKDHMGWVEKLSGPGILLKSTLYTNSNNHHSPPPVYKSNSISVTKSRVKDTTYCPLLFLHSPLASVVYLTSSPGGSHSYLAHVPPERGS